MQTPEEAELQIEREQRIRDLLLMRALDQKLGVERHIIENILLEINLRIVQYVSMFSAFSLEFLTFQTIQDFKQYLVIMQNKKLDTSKPICLLRDEQHAKIFVNPSINKQSFNEGGVMYFLREEFMSK